MTAEPRPDNVLDAARALAPQLRHVREEADRERRLPKAVVRQLVEADLFRLTVPRALGGRELAPLDAAAVVEELATADSAAAHVQANPRHYQTVG